MVTASRILGDQVGSTAPAFLAFLALHVTAGLTAMITGATAALARKGSPRRHPALAAGTTGRSPPCSPPLSAWPSCAGRKDYYLVIIGAATFTAATIGYLHRRLHRPGDLGHIAGMGIAYAAMLTAFFVDNGPHLPLWDRLPALTFWFLPSAVAAPLIVRALIRYRAQGRQELTGA